MTDKEFIDKLSEFEDLMLQFSKTGEASITGHQVLVLNELYPKLVEIAGGNIPKKFNTGCSTCIRDTFRVFTNTYLRLKKELE